MKILSTRRRVFSLLTDSETDGVNAFRELNVRFPQLIQRKGILLLVRCCQAPARTAERRKMCTYIARQGEISVRNRFLLEFRRTSDSEENVIVMITVDQNLNKSVQNWDRRHLF